MRILLLSLGTRGDVQPFVALGKALQRAGHDVTVCASSSFAPWIEEHGLGYAHMNNDIIDLVSSDAGRKATEFVPYDWLLPRVAAVIHHGGAGTTAAGLRAGKPTVICPFVADQPFWGKRVAELGVGPSPIPQRKLTADSLAQAMREAVTNTRIRQRAAELGAKIQDENGLGNAVAFIEEYTRAAV
jgi:UDP:flavonoid glycosyltransferase YjiC (YdhE family)